MADSLWDIVTWPLNLSAELGNNNGTNGMIVVAATFLVPYFLYGVPSTDNGIQPLLMWYGVAGVTNYAAYMTLIGSGTKSPIYSAE